VVQKWGRYNMPEVVEVDLQVKGLIHLEGQRITRIHGWENTIEAAMYEGASILAINRFGKRICFKLRRTNGGAVIMEASLGMTGGFYLNVIPNGMEVKVTFDISNGELLHFCDTRGFGSLVMYTLASHKARYDLKFNKPDVLSSSPTAVYDALCTARGRRIPIKQAIMSQEYILGMGNIYTSEVLFKAKIHPTRVCNFMTNEDMLAITRAIHAIIHNSHHRGGLSVKDYFHPDGSTGSAQDFLEVYMKDRCPICSTAIDQVTIYGRSSYFCPNCQKL